MVHKVTENPYVAVIQMLPDYLKRQFTGTKDREKKSINEFTKRVVV